MFVKVVKSTVCPTGHLIKDKELELDDDIAKELIIMGRVETVEKKETVKIEKKTAKKRS